VVSCFLLYPGGILEAQELFPRTYFTHETTQTYLSLFKGCCNMQKNWIQKYFGPVTVDSVENSRHFAFWRHWSRLANFFIAPKNSIS